MFYKDNRKRRLLNNIALITSSLYLAFTLFNKAYIYNQFETAANKQNIAYKRIETRPAPLQTILWTANIETEEGFYLGYYSWFDSKSITFQYFPKNKELLTPFLNDKELQILTTISNDLYTIEKISDNELIFNDLRFGQLESWSNQRSPFVFAYTIQIKPNKTLQINKRDINNIKDKERDKNITTNNTDDDYKDKESIDKKNQRTVEKRSISSMVGPLWKRVKGN